MNEDLRRIANQPSYFCACIVFIQATMVIALLPSLSMQVFATIGIILLDTVCLGPAFVCKVPERAVVTLLVVMTIVLCMLIFVSSGLRTLQANLETLTG